MTSNLSLDSRTLRIPLNVSLIGQVAARNITREVANVKFRSTVPGGFADCTVDLNRPFTSHGPELTQYALLRVTDTRNGETVWEGRLEDPGRTSSSSGQVWQLAAYGPVVVAEDIIKPYVAVESSMANFTPAPGNPKWSNGSAQQVNDIQDKAIFDGFTVNLTGSFDIRQGSSPYILGSYMYPVFAQSGQQWASMSGSFVNGRLLDVTHKVRLALANDESASVVGYVNPPEPNFNASSAGAGQPVSGPNTNAMAPVPFLWLGGRDFFGLADDQGQPIPARVPILQWIYRGTAAQTVGPQHWVGFGGPVFIKPYMYDQFGNVTLTLAGYSATSCRSDEVFADLIWQRLPTYDAETTTITSGTDGLINQFSYPDPTSTAQMLNDLVDLEGGLYFWAAWESYNRSNVWKARAEWSLWPSTPRHVIGMDDGCDLPTSTEKVYDAVSVRWKDAAGKNRTTTVTTTNPILAAAGLHRQGEVDAGDNVVIDELGAIDFGTRWLADHAYPRGSGTLTVSRPVMDRDTGRMVSPWELRPGCLVQVAGADPSAGSQGAVSRNGRNVFRVVGVEFDASDGSARLELDTPAWSIASQAAEANRNKITRRR